MISIVDQVVVICVMIPIVYQAIAWVVMTSTVDQADGETPNIAFESNFQ